MVLQPTKGVLRLALLVAALALSLAASAQYSVDWHTIAAGGGTSTNGQYSVSGTVGQPATEAMSAGPYTVQSGFWGLIAAIQTPGAPSLAITHSGSSVIVSWPYPSSGWTLQQNTNVAKASGWQVSGYTISNNGTNNSITITTPTGNLFFRLKWP